MDKQEPELLEIKKVVRWSSGKSMVEAMFECGPYTLRLTYDYGDWVDKTKELPVYLTTWGTTAHNSMQVAVEVFKYKTLTKKYRPIADIMMSEE